jgi:ankyrin repeat protein
MALAELAIAAGADLDAAQHDGRPALNELVRWGQFTPALWLLDKGASPNVPDERGWTALHQAASRGNARVFGRLLAAGGDPQRRATDGRTPADVAKAMGREDILALLAGGQAGSSRQTRQTEQARQTRPARRRSGTKAGPR